MRVFGAEKRGKMLEAAKKIAVPFLEDNGLLLYHITWTKEAKDWFLRLFIDKLNKNEYISTDDCEKVSRFLSEELDKVDTTDRKYYLEVSSPGIDRILYTNEHFDRYEGSDIDLNFYKPINGSKKMEAVLVKRVGESIIVKDISEKVEDLTIEIPIKQISRARLAVLEW
jgi:ribosome maturation factor RimP